MLLIFNRQIPVTSKIGPAFRSFYGISFFSSLTVCKRLGINYTARFSDLRESEIFFLNESIYHFFKPDYILVRNVAENINFKIKNGSYKGFCMAHGLPSRGQRSKTNGMTAKRLLPLQFVKSIR